MKTRITTLTMHVTIAAVVLAASSAAWAAQCPTAPSYNPDFTSNQSCLQLNGNYNSSPNSTYPTFVGSTGSTLLRLTPNAGLWAGSAWYKTQQSVAGAFSTTFTFRIGSTSAYDADGFAFVIQNSSLNALAYRGCGVGFGDDTYYPNSPYCALPGGIPSSLAVEFKTYNDGYPTYFPNTANSVSIMSNGTGPNCIDYSCTIAANNSLQLAGTVNTSGTTVTLSNGSLFNTAWAPGTAILINGVSYSIASVTSATVLTVTTTLPTLTGAPYSVGANVAGAVSTSGTAVTWVSGTQFNTSWDAGTQILINGVAYTIASVSSATSLTVSTAPPTSTAVPYSVGTILTDGAVHIATITYTLQPTASASPNCFVDNVAEPCLDVILDGNDLFNGGTPLTIPGSSPAALSALVGGSSAYVGFTAGTAGGNDDQDILSWAFTPQSQSQSGTVNPGQTTPTVFSFNGGCDFNGAGCTNNGYDLTAQETNSSQNQSANVLVTAIPIISGSGASPAANQAACNAILQLTLTFDTAGAPAQCFVIQNGGGPGVDAPVMFEITCPQSQGGTCGSSSNPDFFASLGADFTFSCQENPNLQCGPPPLAFSFGFPNITASTSLPEIGFLKGEGPYADHPCAQDPNNPNTPLFQSDQISSFTLGDTSGSGKGGSGGTTSCWTITYQTQNAEWPTISITTPANGQTFTQNERDAGSTANYTCTPLTTVTPMNPNPATGPYLTIPSGSCNGTVGSGSYIPTGTTGPNTFTVQAEDSADNTNSQTVTYYVLGSQTITFPTIPTQNGLGTVTLTASASSGLPVSYSITSGPATVSGNILTITGAGSVTVTASQAGNNTNYTAAAPVSQTFTVNPVVTITGSPQQPITTNSKGDYVVLVTITNSGDVTIASAQVTAAGTALGSASLLSAPPAVTNLAPGANATVTLTFPASAGKSGAGVALKVSGTYTVTSPAIKGNWTLSFRSVTL